MADISPTEYQLAEEYYYILSTVGYSFHERYTKNTKTLCNRPNYVCFWPLCPSGRYTRVCGEVRSNHPTQHAVECLMHSMIKDEWYTIGSVQIPANSSDWHLFDFTMDLRFIDYLTFRTTVDAPTLDIQNGKLYHLLGAPTGTVSFVESSANVGDTIHANYLWDNARMDLPEGGFCSKVSIRDPDGIDRVGRDWGKWFSCPLGAWDLSYATDKPGAWTAVLNVYNGTKWVVFTVTLNVVAAAGLCMYLTNKNAPSLASAAIFELVAAYTPPGTPVPGYNFYPTSLEIYGAIQYYNGDNGDSNTGCDFFP